MGVTVFTELGSYFEVFFFFWSGIFTARDWKLSLNSRVFSTNMICLQYFAQVDTSRVVSQAKADVSAQQAGISQHYVPAQNQAREADIRTLSELARALVKKVVLFYIVVDHRNVFHLNKLIQLAQGLYYSDS